ncbi:NlpC/P60 family protein [Actinomadura sp. NPDC048955]|uniref:C40 family peptidase n=1 Tax=Actinomadura sp. NPDC048955 TaxID=3158228 RepID=UPI0033CC800A
MSAARALMLAGAGCLAVVTAAQLLVAVLGGPAEAGCAPAATGTKSAPSSPGASRAAAAIPTNYLRLYQSTGPRYGIAWPVLAGIGKVETDHGHSTLPGVHSGQNFAGAGGPMQFLQATWDSFGVDGDGDGVKDRYNPADAIPGAANYLKHNHADQGGDRLRSAIYQYNHSWDYVELVLSWAKRYASGAFTFGDGNTTGQCAPGGQASGPLGRRIVTYATRQIGLPYQWAGGDRSGPTVGTNSRGDGKSGFDCSGLALYAVYQATGGRLEIPHNTTAQWNLPKLAPVADKKDLRPGDLIYFGSDLHHMAIYIGDGKFVHAPQTGDYVKISPMSSRSDYAGARRVPARYDQPQRTAQDEPSTPSR